MGNIKFFIVVIEGILSIFSPCILPILPIYLSMLSNSSVDELRDSKFRSGTLIKNTIFFALGISTTFFILGSSISALSTFLNANKNIIMIIGGIIIIFMGLFYLGIIKLDLLNRESVKDELFDANRLLEDVLERNNMLKAMYRVIINKGSYGIDCMKADEL